MTDASKKLKRSMNKILKELDEIYLITELPSKLIRSTLLKISARNDANHAHIDREIKDYLEGLSKEHD
jgi:phosphopantetheine adenylyltransferase